MRVIMTISLLANLLFALTLYNAFQRYDTLLTWACSVGNGGYECREE